MSKTVPKYETVKIDRKSGIVTVTLNRPDQRNALSPTLHKEMLDLLTSLEDDDDMRVMILTGAGPAFCGGQDLKLNFLAHAKKPVEGRKVSNTSHAWALKLRQLPVPTIAKVNGWCFGAGVRIMSLCDLAIASDKAVFGLSEINFASFPAVGALWAPAYHLHPRDLMYLSLTGKRITAKEAETMRLVNEVVPHDKLDKAVWDLAEVIKQKDKWALMECKEAYALTRRLDYDDAAKWEAAKTAEKNRLQGELGERALKAFAQKKYKPGLESYRGS
ncbi:MAG: enoyl-CoA hydratase/isomerase family protein [Nitrososphaerota archaeon]|nr:enoyl-CoA hydratase/isomerase family protein [Nitrososphaerota archaeon]